MRIRTLVGAVLAAAAVSLWSLPPDDLILREDMGPGSALIVYRVSCEKAQASPAWTPERATAPLPLAKAVALAKQWVKDVVGFSGATRVASIELSPVYSEEVPDRWFYSVALVPADAAQAPPAYVTTVVILMNGEVVVPQLAK